MTLHDLENKTFEKASFGGYKQDSVDQFLGQVSEHVKQLQQKADESKALQDQLDAANGEIDELEEKIFVLADKLQEYRGEEGNLRVAMSGAQRMAENILREAKHRANIMVKQAESEAASIVSESQRKTMHEQFRLNQLQKEVTDFKSRLLSVYKNHLETISTLPSVPGVTPPMDIDDLPVSSTQPDLGKADTPADSLGEPTKTASSEEDTDNKKSFEFTGF